jgi:hypothetical protein
VIGTRSADKRDAGSWIVEVTKSANAEYVATDYVSGALEGTLGGVVGGVPLGAACSLAAWPCMDSCSMRRRTAVPRCCKAILSCGRLPSSITYQANLPAGAPLFPDGSLLITSYFDAGLYAMTLNR